MQAIKILVIDDEVADGIKENLEGFKVHQHTISLDVAKTCQDGIRRIEELKRNRQFYDVLIVDMKMEDSEENGLNILRLPVPSVKVVLTALAKVENCIDCLKTGAFDYIDKNSLHYDPYERLRTAIRNGLAERLEGDETPFNKWYSKNLPDLKQRYGGKYIAVISETVVDEDEKRDTLKKRVKKKYPFFHSEIVKISAKP